MDNYLLTIFTPVYNRAHTIKRTYKSLCRQTCKDFEWLVVDDGSTDDIGQLVKGWIAEKIIPIRYIYQENQGMHGAHNTAYKNIHTELNTCIDSDDWMPDDAVEKIVAFWKKYGSSKVAGIMGLDFSKDGKLIGNKFPDNILTISFSDMGRLKIYGDKKMVYRTDVVVKYPPYPIFKGERYVGLDWLYNLIDQDYQLLTLNECLVIVDYQTDGSSMNMYRQYWNNPRGFQFYRREHLMIADNMKDRIKTCIHYVSSSVMLKDYEYIKKSPRKLLTVFCTIPGILLFLLIRYKVKHQQLMKIR